MTRRRQVNSRRRQPLPRNGSAMPKQVRTALDGQNLRGRADPPTYQSTPWNTIVVGIRYTPSATPGRANLTTVGLNSDIINQLGIGSADLPSLQMRIQSLQFWAQDTDGITPTSFNCDVYDLSFASTNTDNNTRILTSLTDVGGRNHYAKSGYIYPRTQQNTVLYGGFVSEIFGIDTLPNTSVIAYVRCLWRFTPPMSVNPDLKRELIKC